MEVEVWCQLNPVMQGDATARGDQSALLLAIGVPLKAYDGGQQNPLLQIITAIFFELRAFMFHFVGFGGQQGFQALP
jgi:hypothetical protein